MGPALQRLLARPSSLDLLRCLIRKPSLEDVWERPFKFPSAHRHSHRRQCRPHTAAAAVAHATPEVVLEEPDLSVATDSQVPATKGKYLQRKPACALGQFGDLKSPSRSNEGDARAALPKSILVVQGELSLDGRSRNKQGLVDEPNLRNDLKLWASLIELRMRQQGDRGVRKTWNDLQARGIQIPTDEPLAGNFWPRFLDVGFQSELFLNEVIHHADKLCERFGKQWPELYIYIMQHMMLKGKRSEVLPWHERLSRHHAPGVEAFRRLVHDVICKQGDQQALKMVYRRNNHHHLYDEIVPVLIRQQDFQSALSWHFILMRHGDFPSKLEIVEPLIRHYAINDPPKAIGVRRNLADAGFSLASKISIGLKKNNIISRETMNLIHGETFGISQKKYNDGLGARWLATRWVSLDIAISALHALGVESIGPLSLQAIALREGTPKGIIHRIDQLRELGISVGKSVFSKAVESFARKQELEYLHGLLQSDQHPESLEDWKLQEALLAAYAREGDRVQFRRTIAIRLLESGHPKMDQYNITLRVHVTNGDRTALLRTLEEMRMSGFAVRPITIQYLLHKALPRRRRGHAPNTYEPGLLDLNTIISILKNITKVNKYMPGDAWQGILRRLGMLGRLDELDRLCLWLITWHKPGRDIRSHFDGLRSTVQVIGNNDRSAAQFRTFHRLRPLQILFSDAFQQAVVEWGFIHQPLRQPSQLPAQRRLVLSTTKSNKGHDYTRGLRLLKLLQKEGVFVETNRIRRAVLNRLALLYGSRKSNSVRNRILKQQNHVTLEDMVEQINRDWGEELLPDIELVKKRVQKV
jgi:hypothetical protein